MSVTPPLERATRQTTRTSRSTWLPLLIAATLAFVTAALLAVAPVHQSRVDVSWPQSGSAVESTALVLTNQTPHTLDVAFSGTAADEAASQGGTVLATIDPKDPTAPDEGLVITAANGRVTFDIAGASWTTAFTGADQFTVRASIDGFEVEKNGTTAHTQDVLPPQIDGLLTDATGIDKADLHARLQLVDDANDRPTALKIVLLVIALLLLVASLALLWIDDRRRTRPATPFAEKTHRVRRALRSLSPADAVFVVFIVVWALVGSMTDDDGYYATMSYNATEAGYVGQYYQLFNQSFTPFTWLWQFFDVWSHTFGRAPFVLRIPAVIAAIVAWFITRHLLNGFLARTTWWRAEAARLLLAVVSLVWWGAYTIGARPEPVAAMAAVAVVALLARSHRTRRLLPAALAVAFAAVAFAAHPIGIVAAAPLVVSIPMLWRIARADSTLATAVARTVAVGSAAAIALVLAFGDGTLADMLTGSKRFALVEGPLTWLDEWRRYGLLLADIPMGSYARRSVVLVGLVLLVWFIVFAFWSRRVAPYANPVPLSLIGWSFGFSFVLMWITTSKWTHHFGSLASLGPLFIVVMVVVVPRLIRAQIGEAGRLPVWFAPAVLVSFLPPMILSIRGVDQWAYEWGEFISRPDKPEIAGISLGNYFLWGLGAVALIVLGCLWARRKDGSATGPSALASATALVSVFFLATGGYMFGTFISLALPSHPGFTTGKATVRDPWGTECLPDKAVRLWDAAAGVPLTAVSDDFDSSGFAPSGPGDELRPAAAADLPTWTTQNAEEGIGQLTSGWYAVPPLTSEQQVGVITNGDFMTGSVGTLSVELRNDDGETETLPVVGDGIRTGWSTMILPIPDALAEASGLELRLVVSDLSAVPGKHVTVSAPTVVDPITLDQVAPKGAPTAVGWTQSFWFPCDRPMTIARGVIEPPVFATTFGPNGIDNIWVPQRGGSLVGVSRLATVNTPSLGLGDSVSYYRMRVHLFDYPVAEDAYDLTQTWVTTPGWRSAFDPASQLLAKP